MMMLRLLFLLSLSRRLGVAVGQMRLFGRVHERRSVKHGKLYGEATLAGLSKRATLGMFLALTTALPVAAQEAPPPTAAVPPAASIVPSPAAPSPSPPPAVAPSVARTAAPGSGEVRVRIVTSDGAIVVDLDRAHAPLTTSNFLKYVDQHRFDGTSFYRADKVGPPGLGLIQGGVRGDPKRILPPVAHEPTTKTGLAHIEGTISMARLAPGSARGDFFITTGPLSSLDAHPQEAGDNAGFAAFGHVVDGIDVVRHILDAPVSAAGEGAMRGQLLAKPVKIVSVRRGG